jgi:hypothetical protein
MTQTRYATHGHGQSNPHLRARNAREATIHFAMSKLPHPHLACSERVLSTARIKERPAKNNYDDRAERDPDRHTVREHRKPPNNLFTFVNFSSCLKSKGLKEKLGSYACKKMLTLRAALEVRK